MADLRGSSISVPGTQIPDVPDAPTVSAVDVGTGRAYNNGAATVTVTSTTGGRPSSYTVTSSPGSFTASGSSPLTVTGLSSATAYTFTATGTNSSATGPASSASNSITATTVPQAPTIGTFTDGGTGTTGTLSFTAGATGGSSITNYKVSTDNSTYTALSPAQTTSPLSLSGLSVGTATYYIKAVNANGDSSASSGVSGTVIQPTAFESIATATGTGSSGTITFSSIPGTYQHLQIRFIARYSDTGVAIDDLYIRFNGDTSSSYARHRLFGDGSSVTAAGNASAAFMNLPNCIPFNGTTASTIGTGIIDIHDYASTTKNKTLRAFGGSDINGTGYVNLASGFLNSTSAITSITLYNSTVNFLTSSVFALYGIKGA